MANITMNRDKMVFLFLTKSEYIEAEMQKASF